MNAIEVNNLTKIYRLYNSPKDRLRELLSLRGKKYHHEFYALKDVSFQVEKGQTVGIIGQNGSGKSTLLQIICGVLQPTSGSAQVKGRVAALLELGAGFNHEFTGRENVYMNGALMGFTRREIELRFPDIESFAEIGEFIDQPVKTYSSGMFVRLAFAVAINVDPDILVIDEALSVGDMYFQAKCMVRIKKMIEKDVTILFVSHDMGVMKAFCKNCVYLEQGKMIHFGKASDVVDRYIANMNLRGNKELTEDSSQKEKTDKPGAFSSVARPIFQGDRSSSEIFVSTDHEEVFAKTANRYGEGGVKILDIKLLNSQRRPAEQIELRENFFIQVSIVFEKDFPTFAVGYSIRDLKGLMLVGMVTSGMDIDLPSVRAGEIYVFEIKSENTLTQGVYMISIGVELPIFTNEKHIFLDILENAVIFRSILPADPRRWFPAMVLVPAEFTYTKL
ncbi:MAG: ABC transporter ATP-binding protein [Candidatus Manganitrophus sp.]|nr:ABC transporter ATP-binding protein [Candidatus Manganitrophus sp.]MDC4223278.1 ABC transporter ATP-binding protein [Candidatus Manganitrophus sp.]WDT71620.1 MAG: ABC transporter ATP-binding protein [Candidatus Manganitrophus sp.]WDT76130.1 MAG: ABC transporter ATP-binding protein [Candidatus Manganitrophus sp.]WDT81032.1 MAG: ABC transporter ATP-binding protein [Candidatus Manganitrophus sp.]